MSKNPSIDKYTPAPDILIDKYGPYAAIIWGKIFLLSKKDGYSYASHETIANYLGITRKTVSRNIDKLINGDDKDKSDKGGYIKDRTPNRSNRPHEYKPTNKIIMPDVGYESPTEAAPLGKKVPVGGYESPLNNIFNKQVKEVKNIISTWSNLFPNKRRSKPATLKAKTQTRLKNPEFVENWKASMVKASKSSHLQSAGWFSFAWFVKNDENFQKILDGVFDGFGKQKFKQNGHVPERTKMLRETLRNG